MSFTADQQTLLYKTTDSSSFSNYHQVVTTNINLEWVLNFEEESISGSVEHVMKVLVDGTNEVIFDTNKINIKGDILINNEVVGYALSDQHPSLGRKLVVNIPETLQQANTTFNVHITYSIDNTASATQWVQPSATKGGKHPFLFTQSQAIHARSLFPCQDTPGVKAPYHAVVYAPEWCTVLMSALEDHTAEISAVLQSTKKYPELKRFVWTQLVPTSSYLIALAAGRLASKDISDRVRIWAEPEVIDAAHYEFAETEEFLTAAEQISNCPYVWTRYDVLCLPPSFPYGGMENPCLTFATPTLLAGDRSLADVIAHEIAHSWTGNLVTNAVWDHFWLNEGWTVWLERKITSKVKNNKEVGKLSAQIGYKALIGSVEQLGADSPFTQVVWPLEGDDPDDAFSSVPYEKGFNLLTYLETIVGEELFLSFFQAYINQYKNNIASSGNFRDFFLQFVKNEINTELTDINNSVSSSSSSSTSSGGKKNKNKNKKNGSSPSTGATTLSEEQQARKNDLQAILKNVEELDWPTLFFSRGLPTTNLDFSNSLSANVKQSAQAWITWAQQQSSSSTASPSPKNDTDFKNWSSTQVQLFLDTLVADQTLNQEEVHALVKELEAAYQINSSGNAEINLRFQSLALKGEVDWIVPAVEKFLVSQGRMKFVRPLYRALRASKVGAKAAVALFDKHKQIYHPIASKMIERDMTNIAAKEKETAAVAFATEDDGEEIDEGDEKDGDEAKSTAATIATTTVAEVEFSTTIEGEQQVSSTHQEQQQEQAQGENEQPEQQQQATVVQFQEEEIQIQPTTTTTKEEDPLWTAVSPTKTPTTTNTMATKNIEQVPTTNKPVTSQPTTSTHKPTNNNNIIRAGNNGWSWPIFAGVALSVGLITVAFATRFIRRNK